MPPQLLSDHEPVTRRVVHLKVAHGYGRERKPVLLNELDRSLCFVAEVKRERTGDEEHAVGERDGEE